MLSNSGLTSTAADTASDSVNATGLALHRQSSVKGGNALLSPWSIQNVMAMVFAGADGKTRTEMDAALHLGGDAIHPAFKALSAGLAGELPKGAELRTANRLFPAESCKLLPGFMETITENYGAATGPLDFSSPEKATGLINTWVSEQTAHKINDLIPKGALNKDTRLVLTNAVYFKVPWQERFTKELTKELPFYVSAGTQKTLPLMFKQAKMRYAKKKGFQMAALPYSGGALQFTVILPDKVDGLAAVEKTLTPALLAECATMPLSEVRLTIPRFRMEPAAVELQSALSSLGMKSAFTEAANFTRMSREPLFISKVYHKAFIDVNEDGTEAAAATAAEMKKANGHPHEVPHMTVRADHPFVFAIQHVSSGACLFLGRLTDPDPAKPAKSQGPKAD
jgi:serpin B